MFELVEALACSRSPVSAQVRTALAEKFRTLWHRSGLPIELANVCRAIRTACFWPEGWVAVRQTLDLDGSGLDPENLRSLTALESDLRPTDLIQKVHSAVFSSRIQGIDFDDYEGRGTEDIGVRMARTEALAQDLGKAVALQEDVFRELLPELISREGRLVSFGEGLAIGTTDAESVWGQLVTALTAIDGSKGRPEILYGFLHRLNIQNPTLVGTMLDNAVEHDTLSRFYPFLQCAVKIENQDVARLKYSLELGKTPVEMYKILSYGRATDPIPPHDLKELLFAFAARPSGFDIAVEVLYMWLHPHEKQEGIAQELIDAGCQLIDQLVFSKKKDREDYRLGVISKSCLIGAAGARVTKDVLGKLIVAVRKYETNAFYHDDLLEGLFSAQPVAALDGLFGDSEKELDEGIDVIQQAGSRKPPLAGVPEAVFVEWCDKRPKSRYPAMARVIPILKRNGNSEPPVWTAIALHFLEHAPEPGKVLKSFIGEFLPSNSNGWAGSVAATLESNAPLLDQLGTYPKLNADVAEMKQRLQEWIENEKQKETAFGVQRDERFE
jgi:hypothetical protein